MNFSSQVKQKLLQLIQQMGDDPAPFVRDPKKDFTRKRKLPFTKILFAIIAMEASTLKKDLYKVFQADGPAPSPSVFCQQRAKLSVNAFLHLLYGLNASFPGKLFHGFSVVACDGSELNLPLCQKDGQAYLYRKREGQKNYFQLHMNMLYDLVNRRYLDILMEPRKGHDERKAFLTMLGRGVFHKQTIFIMDRGYEGYGVIGAVQRRGMFFIIRAKDNKSGGIIKGFHVKGKGGYDLSFHRKFTTRRGKAILSQPDIYHTMHWSKDMAFLDKKEPFLEMTLRIVRVQTAPGEYECLLTNLPACQFPLQKLKELYWMRWGIETSFREIKYAIGLNSLHAKKVEYIEQEAAARAILYNFCSIITTHITIEQKERKYTYQINFTMAVFFCRRFLCAPVDGPPLDIGRLIAAELLPVRPGRTYKRKLHYHPAIRFNYRFG